MNHSKEAVLFYLNLPACWAGPQAWSRQVVQIGASSLGRAEWSQIFMHLHSQSSSKRNH